MDCSLPVSSVHGISLKSMGVGCHVLLQGTFPTQGSNYCLLCLLHCRWILYCWATREAHIQCSQSFFLWIQQCVNLTILKFCRYLWIVYLKLKNVLCKVEHHWYINYSLLINNNRHEINSLKCQLYFSTTYNVFFDVCVSQFRKYYFKVRRSCE